MGHTLSSEVNGKKICYKVQFRSYYIDFNIQSILFNLMLAQLTANFDGSCKRSYSAMVPEMIQSKQPQSLAITVKSMFIRYAMFKQLVLFLLSLLSLTFAPFLKKAPIY